MGVSAAPSASVLNFVTARAMLPGLSIMFASLGSIKVRRRQAELYFPLQAFGPDTMDTVYSPNIFGSFLPPHIHCVSAPTDTLTPH